jgi:tetratricopeptide (TPR) repeat protein
MQDTPNATIDGLLREGMAEQQNSRLDRAEACYRAVLQRAPGHPDAQHLLGLIAHQKHRSEEALRLIRGAVEAKPAVAMFRLNLAAVLQALARNDEAAESYGQGLALDPKALWARLNLGGLLLDARRYDEAASTFRGGLGDRPDEPNLLNGLGVALLSRGKAREAVEPLRRVTTLQPGFAQAHHNLATALADIGRLNDSARAAERAVAANPNLAAAHWHLGLWHYDRGDLAKALATFDHAAKAGPGLALAPAYAGVVLGQLGESAEAERRFAAALEIDPSFEGLVESYRYAADRASAAASPPAWFGFKASLLRSALARAEGSGLVLEFGVYTGRSIGVIAEATKGKVHGFDSFRGLPEDWIEGESAGSYDSQGQLPEVPKTVKLHVGLFDETLPPFLQAHSEPARFVHLDCDLYSSTRSVLETLDPRLVSGTVLVFDEYFAYSEWRDHEFKAFQEYVERSGKAYEYLAFGVFTRQAAIRLL